MEEINTAEKEAVKVLEFYSGIGGMHYALETCGISYQVVGAYDINTNANAVYKHNFPGVKLLQKNLEGLTVRELEKMNAQCWTMSPPCQPYTRQGKQGASQDPRAKSFLHILDLFVQMEKPPTYLLIENVKGFEDSDTRQRLVQVLHSKGYHFKEYLVTPSDFGIPNSRLRYYMLAKQSTQEFVLDSSFPSESWQGSFKKKVISEYMDLKIGCDSNDFKDNLLIPDNILSRFHNILDIVYNDSAGSCCFTKAYSKYVEGTGSVYSVLPREQVKDAYAKIQEEDCDDKKLELLKTLKLHYFSHTEIARLLCFPADFTFPDELTVRQRYQLLGNSVNVFVISFLMKEFLFSKC